jgi:DNA-binding GntR family transcriptional regulator
MRQHPQAIKKIRTVRDLRGEVYKMLRRGITSGALEPGKQLKENELVAGLDVSRTPIREALNQLSKEGLVEIIPRRGAFVRRWTKDEALEILLIREALEGLAGRLAATKMTSEAIDALEDLMSDYKEGRLEYVEADKRFHEGIINACGMDRLRELIGNLYDSLQMRKILGLSFNDEERIRQSIAEHLRIVSALRTGEEDTVEQAVRDHFRKTRFIVERI